MFVLTITTHKTSGDVTTTTGFKTGHQAATVEALVMNHASINTSSSIKKVTYLGEENDITS